MDEKKEKSLKPKSFIMDINILEAPFFLFNQARNAMSVKELKKQTRISENVRDVLNLVPTENEKSEIKYFKWIDSKGLEREMLAMSIMTLPRKFTMDVWYALLGLYIKKVSPISYNSDTRVFDLKEDFLYFTFYELAKFMRISTGGRSIAKIKDAIRELKSAQYFSFANGTIYDKSREKYIKSKERGISLILDYSFDCEKKEKFKKSQDKNWIQFNKLVIDNIRYEYIKYLNSETYFSLPSGLTRGLYSYLEANKYTKTGGVYNYIKRSYDVLKNKIPIDFKYSSQLKIKLKKPLENLKSIGFIEDYFYDDEININISKQKSIYFIFKGDKEDIIQDLTSKNIKLPLKKEKKNKFTLKIPKDLKKYLIKKGFNDKLVEHFIKEYDKWDIIKYSLWLEDRQFKNKKAVRDFSSLLTFALRTSINIENTHKHILDFIKKAKSEEKKNSMNRKEFLKLSYEKYLDDEIKKFKKEDEGAYEIFHEMVLDNLRSKCTIQLNQLNMFEKDISDKEKSSFEKQKNLWNDFKQKGEKSELFKTKFRNTIRDFRKLKYFEEFKKDME